MRCRGSRRRRRGSGPRPHPRRPISRSTSSSCSLSTTQSAVEPAQRAARACSGASPSSRRTTRIKPVHGGPSLPVRTVATRSANGPSGPTSRTRRKAVDDARSTCSSTSIKALSTRWIYGRRPPPVQPGSRKRRPRRTRLRPLREARLVAAKARAGSLLRTRLRNLPCPPPRPWSLAAVIIEHHALRCDDTAVLRCNSEEGVVRDVVPIEVAAERVQAGA